MLSIAPEIEYLLGWSWSTWRIFLKKVFFFFQSRRSSTSLAILRSINDLILRFQRRVNSVGKIASISRFFCKFNILLKLETCQRHTKSAWLCLSFALCWSQSHLIWGIKSEVRWCELWWYSRWKHYQDFFIRKMQLERKVCIKSLTMKICASVLTKTSFLFVCVKNSSRF